MSEGLSGPTEVLLGSTPLAEVEGPGTDEALHKGVTSVGTDRSRRTVRTQGRDRPTSLSSCPVDDTCRHARHREGPSTRATESLPRAPPTRGRRPTRPTRVHTTLPDLLQVGQWGVGRKPTLRPQWVVGGETRVCFGENYKWFEERG